MSVCAFCISFCLFCFLLFLGFLFFFYISYLVPYFARLCIFSMFRDPAGNITKYLDANASGRGTASLWPSYFTYLPHFVKWWFHTFFIFSIDKRPRFRSPGWDPHVLTFAVVPWPQQVQAERERWDEEKEAALAAPCLFSAAECVVWMSRLWKPMWKT